MATIDTPFSVGCCDLQWTANGETPVAGKLQADQHLVGRLWYPAPKTFSTQWFNSCRKVPWLPSYEYAYGYSSFLFQKARGRQHLWKPLFTASTYLLGSMQRIKAYASAPVAQAEAKYPLVIFSHGIGGNRTAYSAIICNLVSQGYVVFAVEHADGTASTAKLAKGAGCLYYQGWGTEENRMRQTRYRIGEVLTAYKLLTSMSKGEAVKGLSLSGKSNPLTLLKGLLDVDAVALAGHSYGGATVTALCSQEPAFKCTVAYDPWWGALMADQAALEQWKTCSPILILGSHTWNTPGPSGNIIAGKERQDKLLQATRYRQEGPNGSSGGGAVLLVIAGTAHHTFTDVVPYFGAKLAWVTKLIGFTDRVDPALSLKLISESSLAFLNRHLPLTPEQRRMFARDSAAPLAASEEHMSDAQQKQKESNLGNGQSNTASLQAGDVMSNEHTNGLAGNETLPGRSCEPRVLPQERQVFERICKGHIAILDLAL